MNREKSAMKGRYKIRWTFGVLLAFASILMLGQGPADCYAAQNPLVWVFGSGADETLVSVEDGEAYNGAFKSRIEEIGGEWVAVVTLTNYDAGGLNMECRGTCSAGPSPRKIVIELVGDNVITNREGIGINLSLPVEFAGEGNLKIRALVPMAKDGSCYYSNGDGVCMSIAEVLLAHMREEEWWREAAMSAEVTIKPVPSGQEVEIIETEQGTVDDDGSDGGEIETELTNGGEQSAEDISGEKEECDRVWSAGEIVGAIIVGAYCVLSFSILMIMAIRKIVKNKREKKMTTPIDKMSTGVDDSAP